MDASPISLYTLRARQLKAASAHSLLEGENALILRYPLDETPAQITSQIVTQRGKRMLYIEQASFSPVYPLVYAAAGTMQDGLFTPVSTDCRPKLPLSLPIGDIQSPIAQISDAMGHTAFFEIEP